MAKKKAAKKSSKKAAEKAKPLTKSQILTALSEKTDLAKKDVTAVLDALEDLIEESLTEREAFVLPGILKITKQHKEAQPATTKPNPFKPGEMMEVKAKPASTVPKVRPLKGLKDMVGEE